MIFHQCKLCGAEFHSVEEKLFHETYSRHCPSCNEHVAGENWTPTNWGKECRLCSAERAYAKENDSCLWH